MFVNKNLLKISSIVLSVLLLALLAVQFLPFWSFPACTCTEGCQDRFTANENCEACSVYYKWCVHLDPSQYTGLTADQRRDTSSEWSVSIQQYIWLPTFETCKGITEYFSDMYNTSDYEFMVKDIALMPVVVFFFSLIGAYFGITQPTKSLWSIFGLVASVLAVVTYLTQPIYQIGANWQLHLGVAIAAAVVALIPTYEYLARAAHWLNPKAH